ncbi:hypothetical protein GCM10007108_09000 [Thermogymnomonas acidicola]|uniref:Uncharacterized protein n=2 Tax=Thermogymnomonas acidicola TaxID=399579 RepID=A0AA37F9C5_9ARCH|nr:hypothetical protein GCM10007108_09000 [Thermogymnomonas acidicola]
MGQSFTYSKTPVNVEGWMVEIATNAAVTEPSIPTGPVFVNWVKMDLVKGSDIYFDHLFLEVNYFYFNLTAWNGTASIPVDILAEGYPPYGTFFVAHRGPDVVTSIEFAPYGPWRIFAIPGIMNPALPPLPLVCSGNFTPEPPGAVTYANCSVQYGGPLTCQCSGYLTSTPITFS